MIYIYTTFCPFPNNTHKILIGDNLGRLFIGTLYNLTEINLEGDNYKSILDNIEKIYSLEPIGEYFDKNLEVKVKFPIIRNLIKLSNSEIIGHSDYGDIFLFDCTSDDFNIKILREGHYNRNNRMYQIASINSNNFITCGNYGYFWIYNRNDENGWDVVKNNIHNDAHFALDVYSEDFYIINNYYGVTRIIDSSCSEIAKLSGFYRNLQDIYTLNDLIAAVDYNGYSHLFSKSSSDENRYMNLQAIDCDQSKVYPHIKYHKRYFYAAFPNSLWRFDTELENIQKNTIKCKDIHIIDDFVAVLTTNDLVIINPKSFTTPTDYINYNYLIAGIVGYTDTGKSTFCYKMIYGDYKDDLGTTSGTLTWCLEFDDGDKIFIKDLPGQHDEIEYYFPKLKNCDIILGMCKKKDSMQPWKQTIDMCEKLRNDYHIEHFIFLRSKSDDIEKAPRKAIEAYLERKGFNKDMLFDVSAKEDRKEVQEIINLLGQEIYWEKKKISSENKIKTKLISAIGEARSVEIDKIKLEHFILPGFEDLNPNVLEKFIQKVSDEGNIYYIPWTKEIIFDTEKMGKVESFILNLFSVSEGIIDEEFIISEIKERFSDIDSKELEYYYDEFKNYLIYEEEIFEILPKTFIVKKFLEEELNIQEDLMCTEIKIDKSIRVMDIIVLFENYSLKLEKIARKGLKFTDDENGIIIIEFPELNDFNINETCNLIRIYMKNNDNIEEIFEELYEQLRSHGLADLPKILDFEKKSDDDLENLYYLFNFPDETPVIDFKREIIYKKGKKKVLTKIEKEILKDLIALGNSSYLYNNSAYLVIGLEEKDGIYKSIRDVKNPSVLFQQIVYLCRRFLRPCYNIYPISIKIYDIFKLVESGKIAKEIPFTPAQKESDCNEKIMVIHITRESKECLELNETITWSSKTGKKKIYKGKSWIRIGSHTFDTLIEETKKLLAI